MVEWNRKSRPLHSKGIELVLKWLQEIKGEYGCFENEAGSEILKTGALLLSSCWKHYSKLMHLEDRNFSRHYKEFLEQYLSGIQHCTHNRAEQHGGNKDVGVETRKFFLNCLCLLLGRFESKKFESIMAEFGMQISQVLLSQLHCTDEDVIAGTVCIFKAAVFTPNKSVGSSLADGTQMDDVLTSLLHLLDERDGTARAAIILIAEYCYMSTDSYCLQQVLMRIASGNDIQRMNAMDVLSELIHIALHSANDSSHLAWKDLANHLLDLLGDEVIVIREQASNLLSRIEPSLVLPALVRLAYSPNERVQSSASAALTAGLKYHNQKVEVICMLLDCLSNISQSLDLPKATGDIREGSKFDTEKVLRLIPEWSKSVQVWDSMIGPLIDKMFTEPANATIVRFLSYISEHLADAADVVLSRVLLQMKGLEEIDESFLSRWESRTYTGNDTVQQVLFEHLCPLLVIRLLPLRVFDDLNSSAMYGYVTKQGIPQDHGVINPIGHESVAALLLSRALARFEFEDVRKLAAELCGRIHPKVLFPIVASQLRQAVGLQDTWKIKACLFSVCTSLVVRGRDSIVHPDVLEIRKTLEMVLLWSSSDGDEVSKAQHGCIDCLALMICAELQAVGSQVSNSEKQGNPESAATRNSVLTHVIRQLIDDKNEILMNSTMGSEHPSHGAPLVHSFRLCMANVLISACQKISDTGKKRFTQRTLPRLINSVEAIMHPDIRAACVHVLFSAVYHLKSVVLPYSSDLLKLSLNFLKKESEKERMAGAKLIASLMASEDAILVNISGELLEARSILSDVCARDSSLDLQEVCRKLMACISFP
ncbi:uncharacterized protein LOC120013189 isoform X2 [Tripterygium wilfordii]|uniref:uncharacterized protein LOC120013189 isoform X2 n=1 Tax=Tripterygium wilfordii TaxID=458696 RepID=UPI0018F81597|nr:uncharacterized protein LOC120013189 isoform X2 [Tripterygium wilfordii]